MLIPIASYNPDQINFPGWPESVPPRAIGDAVAIAAVLTQRLNIDSFSSLLMTSVIINQETSFRYPWPTNVESGAMGPFQILPSIVRKLEVEQSPTVEQVAAYVTDYKTFADAESIIKRFSHDPATSRIINDITAFAFHHRGQAADGSHEKDIEGRAFLLYPTNFKWR